MVQPLDLRIKPAPADVTEVELVQVCNSGKAGTWNLRKRMQMAPIYRHAEDPDGGSRGQVAGPGHGAHNKITYRHCDAITTVVAHMYDE